MSTTISRLYSWATDKINGVKITASRQDGELDQQIVALNRKVLCSGSAPGSPIAGQTWVDTTNKYLKWYRNNEWIIISMVHVGTAAPATVQEGDLWYDSTNNILKTYDGAAWTYSGDGPAFSANKAGTDQTSIATGGSGTLITFGTEEYDTNSNFASSIFTPTVAGKYHLYAQALIISVADQKQYTLEIVQGASTVIKQCKVQTSGTGDTTVSVASDVVANGTTDAFKIFLVHNQGSDASVSGETYDTFFQGRLVRA